MRIGFHSNQICVRGTEVALYDYAHYCEELFGHESVCFYDENNPANDSLTIQKFISRFGSNSVVSYKQDEFADTVRSHNLDMIYFIKAGFHDGKKFEDIKTCIHSVFRYNEPHGDRYAYVSKWLGDIYGSPSVPHMINLPVLPEEEQSERRMWFRNKYAIPLDAFVFGRHGGFDTFDIEYVKRVITQTDHHYFVFMNTQRFTDKENCIFLDSSPNLNDKLDFLCGCDAMLHARKGGETFGLAIGEFCHLQKPIVCCNMGDQNHVEMLGSTGYYYTNEKDLRVILNNVEMLQYKNNEYNECTPEKVMDIFKRVFIDE